MQSIDCKQVLRNYRSITIDVHPTETALVVNYEMDAMVCGDQGDLVHGGSKSCQKLIRLRYLNKESDVTKLAEEVIDKSSDLIPPTKMEEIEHLIAFLQRRVGSDPEASSNGDIVISNGQQTKAAIEFVANLTELDSYVELLYEDEEDKIKASGLILQLARCSENLQDLQSDEILIGALARVLREDWKKNVDLSCNIVQIFFSFSRYKDFHHVISQHKIGSLCVDIIEYELQRGQMWKENLHEKQTIAQSSKQDIEKEKEYEKVLAKYQALLTKQDQLILISTYLLLNIAEDIKVEMKMVRRGIVQMLLSALDRDNCDVLVLVLTFLKKLSIYAQNKDTMNELNIVPKMSPLLASDNDDVLNCLVRLILNLSFDASIRAKMVKAGYLPKIVAMLGTKQSGLLQVVLCIAYHFSMDDSVKSIFAFTDCIKKVVKMMLEWPGDRIGLELMALSINLALNKHCAQLMSDHGQLEVMMKRALQFKDPLLLKMLRNISQHEGATKLLFVDFVSDLAEAIHSETSEEFVVECVGILGNLVIDDFDYERLMQDYNLLAWIKDKLSSGNCEDDLVLEVVVFVGTVASDEACAQELVKQKILHSIIELLTAKQEDDEFVLQILYIFYQFLKHDSTRDYIYKETHSASYMLDLLNDSNVEIKKMVDTCLDMISDLDESWRMKVQTQRFLSHNKHWLDIVQSKQLTDQTSFELYGPEETGGANGAFLRESDLFGAGQEDFAELSDSDNSPRPVGTEQLKLDRKSKNRYSDDFDMIYSGGIESIYNDYSTLQDLTPPTGLYQQLGSMSNRSSIFDWDVQPPYQQHK